VHRKRSTLSYDNNIGERATFNRIFATVDRRLFRRFRFYFSKITPSRPLSYDRHWRFVNRRGILSIPSASENPPRHSIYPDSLRLVSSSSLLPISCRVLQSRRISSFLSHCRSIHIIGPPSPLTSQFPVNRSTATNLLYRFRHSFIASSNVSYSYVRSFSTNFGLSPLSSGDEKLTEFRALVVFFRF